MEWHLNKKIWEMNWKGKVEESQGMYILVAFLISKNDKFFFSDEGVMLEQMEKLLLYLEPQNQLWLGVEVGEGAKESNVDRLLAEIKMKMKILEEFVSYNIDLLVAQ